jgi:hypothetical protein
MSIGSSGLSSLGPLQPVTIAVAPTHPLIQLAQVIPWMANAFRRTIDDQLVHASSNGVPRAGHAINAGIGWLVATAHQITELDIKIE